MVDRKEGGETLEQFADRIARETRDAMMTKLPDDIIGRLGHSHLIFGKACVMSAFAVAMKEGRAALEASEQKEVVQ